MTVLKFYTTHHLYVYVYENICFAMNMELKQPYKHYKPSSWR